MSKKEALVNGDGNVKQWVELHDIISEEPDRSMTTKPDNGEKKSTAYNISISPDDGKTWTKLALVLVPTLFRKSSTLHTFSPYPTMRLEVIRSNRPACHQYQPKSVLKTTP